MMLMLEAAVENKDGDELASKRPPPPGDGVVIIAVSIPPRPLRRLDEAAAADVIGGYGCCCCCCCCWCIRVNPRDAAAGVVVAVPAVAAVGVCRLAEVVRPAVLAAAS